MAGEVTGFDIDTCKPEDSEQDIRAGCCGSDDQIPFWKKISGLNFVWDDSEEMQYRDWMREQLQDQPEADFLEYQDEIATRQMHKDLTKQNAHIPVDWEDDLEKQYRAKYIEMRTERRMLEKINWDTSREREAIQKSRAETTQRSKQKFEWDDQDERACMDSYRKKYSKS